ncbi:hypothetical protein G5V59_03030 [Nocardioides sp. W3-2-3]|nr:hypothetical protein [Nocardioides convexus]
METRQRVPVAVVDDREYLITDLGQDRGPRTPARVVPAPLFADILVRESVIKTAALAAGLRRALSPEVRNRIRFEMKREVKRSRKQRKAPAQGRPPRPRGPPARRRRGVVVIRSGVVFVAGAAAGVYGMVKVRRLAEALTPDGMRDRVNAVVLGARLFADEVAQGRADAETHLRERYRALEAGARSTMTAPVAALTEREEEHR